MKIIELDASGWSHPVDFCEALFPAVGAVQGHGCGVDALNETFVWGGVNAMTRAFTVEISGLNETPFEVRKFLQDLEQVIIESRKEYRRATGRSALGHLKFK